MVNSAVPHLTQSHKEHKGCCREGSIVQRFQNRELLDLPSDLTRPIASGPHLTQEQDFPFGGLSETKSNATSLRPQRKSHRSARRHVNLECGLRWYGGDDFGTLVLSSVPATKELSNKEGVSYAKVPYPGNLYG